MQFLTIKKQKRQRKDGRPYAQAVVIKKNRKFGQVLEQKCISTKKPVLITGAHASGKSYWLDRPKFRCFRLKTPPSCFVHHLPYQARLTRWLLRRFFLHYPHPLPLALDAGL
jgi:hypothetical protein